MPFLDWYDVNVRLPLSEYLISTALSHWKCNLLLRACSVTGRPVEIVVSPYQAADIARVRYEYDRNVVRVNTPLIPFIQNPFAFRRELAHALVNHFDTNRTKFDPRSFEHLACSELRGFNLSGESDLWVHFFRDFGTDWLGRHMFSRKQIVIKERVVDRLSEIVKNHFGDNQAAENTSKIVSAVDSVYQRCFRDHWPFTTEPHLDSRFRYPAEGEQRVFI